MGLARRAIGGIISKDATGVCAQKVDVMAAPLPEPPSTGLNFFVPWGMLEWAIGGIWSVAVANSRLGLEPGREG